MPPILFPYHFLKRRRGAQSGFYDCACPAQSPRTDSFSKKNNSTPNISCLASIPSRDRPCQLDSPTRLVPCVVLFPEFSGWPSGQERNGNPRSPSRPSLDNCMGIWRSCLKDAGCPCLGIEGLHCPAYSSSNTRCRNVGLFNVVPERPETSQPLARHRRSLSRMWTISGGTT